MYIYIYIYLQVVGVFSLQKVLHKTILSPAFFSERKNIEYYTNE